MPDTTLRETRPVVFGSAEELARSAARQWLTQLAARRPGVPYCAALSGGRIARLFFSALAGDVRAGHGSLDDVHFFWADERCVPPGDAESNFRLARELLFAPLTLPAPQIHRVAGEKSPAAAAAEAAEELRRLAAARKGDQPVLDIVFLGLGEDGHVASLFPAEPPAQGADRAVYRPVLNSTKPPPERVTLGYPALAAAREVWVLVSGAGKQAALRESLRPGGTTPLARVLSRRNKTTIFSDVAV